MPSLPLSDTESTPKPKHKKDKTKKTKEQSQTEPEGSTTGKKSKKSSKLVATDLNPSVPDEDGVSGKKENKKKRKASHLDAMTTTTTTANGYEENSSELVDHEGSREDKEKKEKKKKKKKAKLEEPPLMEEEQEKEKEEEVEEKEDPNAVSKFRISEPLREKLKEKGIESLFPIQSMTFDTILDGSDLVGRARTGQVPISSYHHHFFLNIPFLRVLCGIWSIPTYGIVFESA